MAHRYEAIPLTQGDGNDSTESDIETRIDETQLEFPPPPFSLPNPDGKTLNEPEQQTPSDASIWASVIKQQEREKPQEPPVVTTVNDPGTSKPEEQHESISKPSGKPTLRQPVFSDKASNESACYIIFRCSITVLLMLRSGNCFASYAFEGTNLMKLPN